MLQVLIWSIADHVTSLTASGGKGNGPKGEKLAHRIKLEVRVLTSWISNGGGGGGGGFCQWILYQLKFDSCEFESIVFNLRGLGCSSVHSEGKMGPFPSGTAPVIF